MGKPARYPGTPRWVYAFGAVLIGLVVIVIARHVLDGGFRGHGP